MRFLLGLLFLALGSNNISGVQQRGDDQYNNNNKEDDYQNSIRRNNNKSQQQQQRRNENVEVYHNNEIVQTYETDLIPQHIHPQNLGSNIASQSCPDDKRFVVTCLDGTENECHDEIEDANITIVNPMNGTDFFAVCVDNAAEYASLLEYAAVHIVEPDVIRTGSVVDVTYTKEEIEEYRQLSRQLSWTSTASNEYQWNINSVGAPAFWNTYNKKGDDITVCIVDSGIDRDHPRFGDTTMDGSNEGNLVDPWYEDIAGHGTHVGGIIGAEDRGRFIVGVAPNAKLFITRIFDDTIANSVSSLILALNECQKAGSRVINLSLGGPSSSSAEEIEMNKLIANGTLVIAAAGNSGNCCSNPVMYPASYSQLMSVAALKSNTESATFSTHNYQVDISAPGNYIQNIKTGGGLIHKSGTSMACPHVVGAAALLMSQFPNEPASKIREALQNSAVDLGPCGYDDLYGHGRVDVMAAAEYIENDLSGRPSDTRTCIEVTVAVTVDDDGDETKWRLYVQNDSNATPKLFFRGGPYPKDDPKTYTQTFTIPDGKIYEFRVYDDYNNGHGTYQLTVAGTAADLTDDNLITEVDEPNNQEDYWSYTLSNT